MNALVFPVFLNVGRHHSVRHHPSAIEKGEPYCLDGPFKHYLFSLIPLSGTSVFAIEAQTEHFSQNMVLFL